MAERLNVARERPQSFYLRSRTLVPLVAVWSTGTFYSDPEGHGKGIAAPKHPNVTHEAGADTALARRKSGVFSRSKAPTSRPIRWSFRRKTPRTAGSARVSGYSGYAIAWDGPGWMSSGRYRFK